MSIRKRSWGSGSAWFVDIYDAAGKRVRRQFKDRKDAEAFEALICREKRLAQLGVNIPQRVAPSLSLGELFVRVLEQSENTHRPSYLKDEIRFSKFWIKALDNPTLSNITRERVSKILDELSCGRTAGTVNRYLAFIRAALNLAVAWGFLDNNPLKGLKPRKEAPGRVRYLTHEEAEELLNACGSDRQIHMMVMIALYTGMRAGEIMSLEWRDVDLERGFITVRDSKSHRARIIPIPQVLQEYLSSLPKQNNFVVGQIWYSHRFERAARKAGIVDFRFHDLRHTYASWKVMAGVDLRTVAELLGHRTLDMVMRYSHLSPEHIERVREKGVFVPNGHKIDAKQE